jgi:diguanylate cyclase (GGDEF)-like protein
LIATKPPYNTPAQPFFQWFVGFVCLFLALCPTFAEETIAHEDTHSLQVKMDSQGFLGTFSGDMGSLAKAIEEKSLNLDNSTGFINNQTLWYLFDLKLETAQWENHFLLNRSPQSSIENAKIFFPCQPTMSTIQIEPEQALKGYIAIPKIVDEVDCALLAVNIRVLGHNALQLEWMDSLDLKNYLHKNASLLYLFIGMLLAMGIYNLIFYILNQRPLNLRYTEFLIFVCLWILALSGTLRYAGEWITPEWHNLLTLSLGFAVHVFTIRFAMIYLNTQGVGHFIHYLLKYCIFSFGFLALISLTNLVPIQILLWTNCILSICYALSILMNLISLDQESDFETKDYFYATSPFLILQVLLLYEFLSPTGNNLNMFKNLFLLAVVYKSFFLAISVSKRLKLLDKQKREVQEQALALEQELGEETKERIDAQKSLIEAQQITNELLEARIKERTDILEKTLTELQSANHKLEELSTTDSLTELKNRRHFINIAENELARAKRVQTPIAFAIIDADFFKNINDQYGHLAGDECLKQISKLLTKCFSRPTDLAARLGGEEFVLMLPNTDEVGLMTICNKFRTQLENAGFEFGEEVIRFTVSIGALSLIPENEHNLTQILDWVDEALYQAKNSGRNKVVIYPI